MSTQPQASPQTFLVAGHRLEVQRLPASHSHAPELVFLHEGLGSISLWKDFPARIAAATGCPVTIYSRYGSGNSDVLAAARQVTFMHDEARHALPDLLRQLAIENPILVGHSDGASIALIHAAVHDQVRGLVLMAPLVFVEDLTVASIAAAKIKFETTDLPAGSAATIKTPRAPSGDGMRSGSIPTSAAGTLKNIFRESLVQSSPFKDWKTNMERWRK